MPQKHNPVLSVLIRRAAMTTPMLGATLHLAAAQQVDERADGAWHAEWATLRDLVRRTLVAASHAFDLVADLQVDRGRMAATLHGAREQVGAEQWSHGRARRPARRRSPTSASPPSSSTPSSSAPR